MVLLLIFYTALNNPRITVQKLCNVHETIDKAAVRPASAFSPPLRAAIWHSQRHQVSVAVHALLSHQLLLNH